MTVEVPDFDDGIGRWRWPAGGRAGRRPGSLTRLGAPEGAGEAAARAGCCERPERDRALRASRRPVRVPSGEKASAGGQKASRSLAGLCEPADRLRGSMRRAGSPDRFGRRRREACRRAGARLLIAPSGSEPTASSRARADFAACARVDLPEREGRRSAPSARSCRSGHRAGRSGSSGSAGPDGSLPPWRLAAAQPRSAGEAARLGRELCRQLDGNELARETQHARDRLTMRGRTPSSSRREFWPCARHIRNGPNPCIGGARNPERRRALARSLARRHRLADPGSRARPSVRNQSKASRGREAHRPTSARPRSFPRGRPRRAAGSRCRAPRFVCRLWQRRPILARSARLGGPISGHRPLRHDQISPFQPTPASTPVVAERQRRRRAVETAELGSRRRIVHRPEHRLARPADSGQSPPIGRERHVGRLVRHPQHGHQVERDRIPELDRTAAHDRQQVSLRAEPHHPGVSSGRRGQAARERTGVQVPDPDRHSAGSVARRRQQVVRPQRDCRELGLRLDFEPSRRLATFPS